MRRVGLAVAVAVLGSAAGSSTAEAKSCGEVTRANVFDIETTGTDCGFAREVAARFAHRSRKTHSPRVFRHGRRTVRCSWSQASCRYDGRRVSWRWTPRFSRALASWYGLYGSPTACGGPRFVGQHGVAHKTLPCGTRVHLRKGDRDVVVAVIDRGPYVAGREFDLTEATKLSLDCGDLCTIQWRTVSRQN